MSNAEQMYWICADALTFASQAAHAQELPAPDILRQRIQTLFANIYQRARQIEIPEHDIKEVDYALVAFIDEQILRSAWTERQHWMAQPLQFLRFGENSAGEGFFEHLKQLQQTPGKEHIVQIYYLCLSLGFQGKFGVVGGTSELGNVQESARLASIGSAPRPEKISPAGYPREAAMRTQHRRSPYPAIGAAILAVSIILFFVLKFSLFKGATDAVHEIERSVPASSS